MLDDNIKSFRIIARGLLKIISIKMTSKGNKILYRYCRLLAGSGTLRNAQGGSKGIRTCTDLYGLVRTLLRRRLRRAGGTWCSVCHALWNFDSTGLCVLLAGRALCAKHRVGAKNVGLVGQVGLVGRLALGGVCAMCSGNSKILGSLYAPPAVSLRIGFVFLIQKKPCTFACMA